MAAERADHLEDDGPRRSDGAFRDAVAAVMARIAAGAREAVWELHDLAEPSLTRILRAETRRLDLRIGDEDISDLTLDAAVDVAKLARSWKPDGALPWVWARRRVTAPIHGHVGTFARELDESQLEIEAPATAVPVEDPRRALRALARCHPVGPQAR